MLVNNIKIKLQRSLAIHGLKGTFRLCVDVAKQLISKHQQTIQRDESDLEFDSKYNVDTSGSFLPQYSNISGQSWFLGSKYQAANANVLSAVLIQLKINYEHFTFIDLGAGKGRAILLASQFPFKKVIGVEYDTELCEIAKKNLLHFPDAEKKCKNCEIICADASQFKFPEDPLVIFLFNPFRGKVMTQLVENITTFYQKNRREIIVVYFTPVCADIWRNTNFMHEFSISESVIIFKTNSEKNINL